MLLEVQCYQGRCFVSLWCLLSSELSSVYCLRQLLSTSPRMVVPRLVIVIIIIITIFYCWTMSVIIPDVSLISSFTAICERLGNKYLCSHVDEVCLMTTFQLTLWLFSGVLWISSTFISFALWWKYQTDPIRTEIRLHLETFLQAFIIWLGMR